MIPLHSTTIAVLRRTWTAPADTYDPEPPFVPISSGVRAHISTLTAREDVAGGEQVVGQFRLNCDPTDITNLDRVQDESNGEIYDVEWARLREGFDLDHIQAQLKQVIGVTASGA